MAKSKRVTVAKKKKKRPCPSHVNPPIGWRWDLRVGAPRNPRTGSPTLVQMKLTAPGLEQADPMVISDTEDSDNNSGPSGSSSHSAQQLITNALPRAADPGSRILRSIPLRAEDLLLNGVTIAGNRECNDPAYTCGICLGLKSHPVSTQCGHTFCFVCVRLALESSFACPMCGIVMHHSPHRVHDLEDIIVAAYPKQRDNTIVKWETAWGGLSFPKQFAN
ncbi:hypothetical protein B0H11DRAFT_2134874 [Mycena galericulata]|nr:hypothetical protein B0H11DRAFT_2134874 [Mycena galericulata]